MAIQPIGIETPIPPVPPPPPDAPNWDLVNNGNPDGNWQSKYTYVPGTGWVLKENYQNPGLYTSGEIETLQGPKNKYPRVLVIVAVIILLYLLFR